MRREIDSDLYALESIVALYAASEDVTRAEFRAFARRLLLGNESIQALEWIPRVTDAQRHAYEEAARKDGFPDFRITDRLSQGKMIRSPRLKEYYPVYFVEPYKGNEAALGFDLASNPARKKALERSRDTGETLSTGRVVLVQNGKIGFLVFDPVYRHGSPGTTVQSRRKYLEGFTLGVFRVGDLVERAFSYIKPEGIYTYVYDKSAPVDESFLYFHPPRTGRTNAEPPGRESIDAKKNILFEKTLKVAGREWLIQCLPSSEYIAERKTWEPWGILLSGLFFTCLIAGFMISGIRQARSLSDANQRLLNEITVRKRAQEILARSEERFRKVFEKGPVGMLMVGPDLKLVKANRFFCEMMGYSEEELIGRVIKDITFPDDLEESERMAVRLIGGEIPNFRIEKRYVRRNGEIIWATLTATVIHTDEGGMLYGLGMIEDISERKKAGEALRSSEERYHSLFENMLEGYAYCRMIFEHDLPQDFVYLDVNRSFEGLTGLKDVVGKKVSEVIPGIRETSPELLETYGRVALTGKPERFEIFIGSLGIWFSISVYSTEKDHFVAVFDNITERKQREREMKAICDVSSAMRAARTRDEMLPVILAEVVNILKMEGAALAMRDTATGETVIELGRKDWASSTGLRLPPGEGIVGQVISTGNAYVHDDVLSDPNLSRPDLIGDLSCIACVPLVSEEQIIGALVVGRRTPIVSEEVRLLTAIGEIAANAIHRSTLHEQTEQHLKRLYALHDIDLAISSSLDLRLTLNIFLPHVKTQLGVDAAAVLLLNPYTQTLEYGAGLGFRSRSVEETRIRLGEDHAGLAALERRTIIIPDVLGKTEMCEHARGLEADAFVSHHVVPLIVKGHVKGVLEVFHRSPIYPDRSWMDYFESLAAQAAIAIDNAYLFNDLQRSNVELFLAYDATIEGWSRALDMRDRETEGHSQRVTGITVKIARVMGMDEAELVHVRRGALLHDIGKMGIPDSILLKPGKLDDEEWKVMRLHPVYSHQLLSPIAFLQPALDIPYCHHEKWDGSGYPRGLKGESIPLGARIFAVVDVWDALASDRPYRPAWPREKIVEYVKNEAGRHFDPKVVETFLNLYDEKEIQA